MESHSGPRIVIILTSSHAILGQEVTSYRQCLLRRYSGPEHTVKESSLDVPPGIEVQLQCVPNPLQLPLSVTSYRSSFWRHGKLVAAAGGLNIPELSTSSKLVDNHDIFHLYPLRLDDCVYSVPKNSAGQLGVLISLAIWTAAITGLRPAGNLFMYLRATGRPKVEFESSNKLLSEAHWTGSEWDLSTY